jgi:hypothetical protein
VIGESYSLPLFDITITGFDFTEKATSPDDGVDLRPQNGYVTANLYYTVKYTGKAAAYSSYLQPSWLNYGDGYFFNLETFYYYDTGVDAWLNSGDVAPLTPEFPCKACFFVPEEVENEKGNSLFIEFSEYKATFTPRPANDEDKEVIYTYCMGLLSSDVWSDISTARSLMLELDDYKDSAMTARTQCFTYADRVFFKEYVQSMTSMTEDDIRAVLTDNTFNMRNNYGGDNNGLHTVTFHADGSFDAGYTYKGEQYTMYDKWRIENGTVIVITPDGKEKTLTPYQYDETRYLLMELGEFGDNSMILTVSE